MMMKYSSTRVSICLFCEHRLSQNHRTTSGRLRLYATTSSYYSTSERPSFAPKPILDIKHILKNPGLYEQNCIDRNYQSQSKNAWRILELAQERARRQDKSREGREEYNKIKAEIERLQKAGSVKGTTSAADGAIVKAQQRLQGLLEKAKSFKAEFAKVADDEQQIEAQIHDHALALPNLSSTHTPNGDEPALVSTFISSRSTDFEADNSAGKRATSHVDIGTSLDLLDFSSAAATSGWGWYFLKNGAAMLEQALIQYTLSFLAARGWTIISPPSMVYSHIAASCGFAPRDANDEQQIYHIKQLEKDIAKPGLCLAATAEIPLAGMYASRTLSEAELPLKYAAVSRCYRAEAGARGVDTKGLYRVHEFTKVEMFAWTLPDSTENATSLGSVASGAFDTSDTTGSVPSHSQQIFDEMLGIQETLLQSLDLTYRMLEMPSTDLGNPASRKRDIEVLFPSRRRPDKGEEGWGEVTSTSICTDYQSRRLSTRFKRVGGGGAGLEFPHTVNGTAMAIPRVLAALLEYGWDEKIGAVRVPECLRMWMGGVESIGKSSRN